MRTTANTDPCSTISLAATKRREPFGGDAGARVDVTNDHGDTPKAMAESRGLTEMAGRLEAAAQPQK